MTLRLQERGPRMLSRLRWIVIFASLLVCASGVFLLLTHDWLLSLYLLGVAVFLMTVELARTGR